MVGAHVQAWQARAPVPPFCTRMGNWRAKPGLPTTRQTVSPVHVGRTEIQRKKSPANMAALRVWRGSGITTVNWRELTYRDEEMAGFHRRWTYYREPESGSCYRDGDRVGLKQCRSMKKMSPALAGTVAHLRTMLNRKVESGKPGSPPSRLIIRHPPLPCACLSRGSCATNHIGVYRQRAHRLFPSHSC